jgi:hypothetical protein
MVSDKLTFNVGWFSSSSHGFECVDCELSCYRICMFYLAENGVLPRVGKGLMQNCLDLQVMTTLERRMAFGLFWHGFLSWPTGTRRLAVTSL